MTCIWPRRLDASRSWIMSLTSVRDTLACCAIHPEPLPDHSASLRRKCKGIVSLNVVISDLFQVCYRHPRELQTVGWRAKRSLRCHVGDLLWSRFPPPDVLGVHRRHGSVLRGEGAGRGGVTILCGTVKPATKFRDLRQPVAAASDIAPPRDLPIRPLPPLLIVEQDQDRPPLVSVRPPLPVVSVRPDRVEVALPCHAARRWRLWGWARG